MTLREYFNKTIGETILSLPISGDVSLFIQLYNGEDLWIELIQGGEEVQPMGGVLNITLDTKVDTLKDIVVYYLGIHYFSTKWEQ